jgi:hypothetical protein
MTVHRFIAPVARIDVPTGDERVLSDRWAEPLLRDGGPCDILRHGHPGFAWIGQIRSAAVLDGLLVLSGVVTDERSAADLRSGKWFLSLDVGPAKTRDTFDPARLPEDGGGHIYPIVFDDWRVHAAMLLESTGRPWDLPGMLIWEEETE